MDTEVVAALIVSLTSLVGTGVALGAQHRARHQQIAEERHSQAKVVLDSYRGPLLNASEALADRIDNIRHRNFAAAAAEREGRTDLARLSTMFRFAQYFGWREILRTEVQLMRFEDEEDTRLVAALINDVVWAFASDAIDDQAALLWSEEQRAIGELMIAPPDNGARRVIGYARFVEDYEKTFQPWMSTIASAVLASEAASRDRLRLVQWALYGLVMRLDVELVYVDREWVERTRLEIAAATAGPATSRVEKRIREDIARVGAG